MRLAEIVVPWRDNGNPHRRNAVLAVRDHLHDGGSWTIRYVDPGEPWSAARARNQGAAAVKAPVVVFCDADTIVPWPQLKAAAAAARERPGLVYAYDLYLRLAEGEQVGGRVERELYQPVSVGGCAISVESFTEVGGFDSSYLGTHYEDSDFADRCGARWLIRRIPGPAWHLWHGSRRADDSPEDADEAIVRDNFVRWLQSNSDAA